MGFTLEEVKSGSAEGKLRNGRRPLRPCNLKAMSRCSAHVNVVTLQSLTLGAVLLASTALASAATHTAASCAEPNRP